MLRVPHSEKPTLTAVLPLTIPNRRKWIVGALMTSMVALMSIVTIQDMLASGESLGSAITLALGMAGALLVVAAGTVLWMRRGAGGSNAIGLLSDGALHVGFAGRRWRITPGQDSQFLLSKTTDGRFWRIHNGVPGSEFVTISCAAHPNLEALISASPALKERILPGPPIEIYYSRGARIYRIVLMVVAVVLGLIVAAALTIRLLDAVGVDLGPYRLRGIFVDTTQGLSLEPHPTCPSDVCFRLYTTPDYVNGFEAISLLKPTSARIEVQRHRSTLGDTHYSATVQVNLPPMGTAAAKAPQLELWLKRGHASNQYSPEQWWYNRVTISLGPDRSIRDVGFSVAD